MSIANLQSVRSFWQHRLRGCGRTCDVLIMGHVLSAAITPGTEYNTDHWERLQEFYSCANSVLAEILKASL